MFLFVRHHTEAEIKSCVILAIVPHISELAIPLFLFIDSPSKSKYKSDNLNVVQLLFPSL